MGFIEKYGKGNKRNLHQLKNLKIAIALLPNNRNLGVEQTLKRKIHGKKFEVNSVKDSVRILEVIQSNNATSIPKSAMGIQRTAVLIFDQQIPLWLIHMLSNTHKHFPRTPV